MPSSNDLHAEIRARLASLAEARAKQRAADEEVKRLRVEIANLQVDAAAATPGGLPANAFHDLVTLASNAW